MAVSPFDFVRSVGDTKRSLVEEGKATINEYDPFMVNRAFSYSADSVFFANEMNSRHVLGKQEQHDFYFYGLPSKKRFSRWDKPSKTEVGNSISETYDYNRRRSEEIIDILTPTQVKEVESLCDHGGMKK